MVKKIFIGTTVLITLLFFILGLQFLWFTEANPRQFMDEFTQATQLIDGRKFEIVDVKSVSWMRVKKTTKLEDLNPRMDGFPNKEGFLLVIKGKGGYTDGTKPASNISLRSGARCVLVYDDGTAASWGVGEALSDNLLNYSGIHTLKGPLVQLLWNRIK